MATKSHLLCCLLLLLLSPSSLSGETATPSPLVGRWEGAILVRPAELEVGLELDLVEKDKELSGTIAFPTQGGPSHALSAVDLRESAVQIVYKDANNDASVFNGVLSADLKEISGTVLDGGKTIRFALRRVTNPAAFLPLTLLSADGSELRSRFTEDLGSVRVLLILSPTCPYCRNMARLVREYVLDRIQNPALKFLVVWEEITSNDRRAEAEDASHLLNGPRVTNYWAEHRFTGRSFQGALGTKTMPPWDVVLVFGPSGAWPANAPAPSPDYFMHNLKGEELPADRKFNVEKLAEEIESRLKLSDGEAAHNAPVSPPND
ncbi:MAG: hypothetical protein ABJC13_11440 [Acidobacteriota bacterium]